MDGNQSQTQYDNGEIDKLIARHGNNEYFMASDGWTGWMGGRSMQIG